MITFEEWQIIQRLLLQYLAEHPESDVIPHEQVVRIYQEAYQTVHGKSTQK